MQLDCASDLTPRLNLIIQIVDVERRPKIEENNKTMLFPLETPTLPFMVLRGQPLRPSWSQVRRPSGSQGVRGQF